MENAWPSVDEATHTQLPIGSTLRPRAPSARSMGCKNGNGALETRSANLDPAIAMSARADDFVPARPRFAQSFHSCGDCWAHVRRWDYRCDFGGRGRLRLLFRCPRSCSRSRESLGPDCCANANHDVVGLPAPALPDPRAGAWGPDACHKSFSERRRKFPNPRRPLSSAGTTQDRISRGGSVPAQAFRARTIGQPNRRPC